MKLLLIGPKPPPIGGASISFNLLCEEVLKNKSIRLTTVDTSLMNPLKSIKEMFKFLIGTITLIGKIYSCDVVSFHASTRRFYVFGPYLQFWCKFFRKPLQGRVFGSSLKELYEDSGTLTRYLIRNSLKMDQTLLQTKGLVTYFEEQLQEKVNIKWFPTSRPKPAKSTQSQSTDDVLRIIYAGHVREDKGIFELISSIKALNTKGYQVQVDIYGALYTNIDRNFTDSLDNVTYKGEVENDLLRKKIGNYDIMVFPSYYEGEGYPGAIIESLLAGIPVISTNWKFIPEIIEDGINGFLVPIKDSQALAGAIEKLILSPSVLTQLKENALVSASNFDSCVWNGEKFESWIYQLSEENE